MPVFDVVIGLINIIVLEYSSTRVRYCNTKYTCTMVASTRVRTRVHRGASAGLLVHQGEYNFHRGNTIIFPLGLLQYMLAQTAEEIHAPDRAAQVGEGGNSEYQDLGLEVDDDDPTDIAIATIARVIESPFLLAHTCACA